MTPPASSNLYASVESALRAKTRVSPRHGIRSVIECLQENDPMHFISFRLKRAHHASLRVAREIAHRCNLTPARFDLLYAIWETYNQRISQMVLRKVLGVARSTVSRMLSQLEKLGIIRRGDVGYGGDRRTRSVEMTAAGARQFLDLLYMVDCWKEMQLVYEVAFGLPKGQDTFAAMDSFFWRLKTVAEELHDTGNIWYPTGHPDD